MNARERKAMIKNLTALMCEHDGDITIDGYSDGEKVHLDFPGKVSCMFYLRRGHRAECITVHWYGATADMNGVVFTEVNRYHHRKATTFAGANMFLNTMVYYANAISDGTAFTQGNS
ncbi:MAG: hypothetical protein PF495_12725 [Spirochaetales bacterium]|jgi:hypothetical protein|nr:hypothetical protein [Spirochaetales bacterium]